MNVDHRRVQVNGVGLHVGIAGHGSPIVLLHGWPVTSHHWREVVPRLAERHLVIAPDLRGLGDSDRPEGGYDKRTLALDVAGLLDLLGVGEYAVAGHDFGGAVACALADAHRDRVTHLVVVEELLPGCPVPASLPHSGYPRWHGAFHSTPEVPETLIRGRERDYLRFFWSLTGDRRELPTADEYLRTYLLDDTLRTGLAYYRASRADAAANRELARRPLRVPTLAIGGDLAIGRAVEAGVRQVSSQVRGVVLPGCGHYPAEERPEAVSGLIAGFVGS